MADQINVATIQFSQVDLVNEKMDRAISEATATLFVYICTSGTGSFANATITTARTTTNSRDHLFSRKYFLI
jgi:hypothetical protein